MFYRRQLSQYFAFTTRTPEWVNHLLSFDELRDLARHDRVVADDLRRMEDILENAPGESWEYAREASHLGDIGGGRVGDRDLVGVGIVVDRFQRLVVGKPGTIPSRGRASRSGTTWI
ncbi:MAG: hypothetical protein GY856_53065 [bacterium]|nr:hypothetical protein [bacterium]